MEIKGNLYAGAGSSATGQTAFAFGLNVTASGDLAHAEGVLTLASGFASHAEGGGTWASGEQSHAEGKETKASGEYSHAEGANTTSMGDRSHAEGNRTTASGTSSHAEGYYSTSIGYGSHAEGGGILDGTPYSGGTSIGFASHAEGILTISSGRVSHAEGIVTTALGDGSHSEGENTTAIGNSSHSEGFETIAIGNSSHSEGQRATSIGNHSHSEGYETTAIGTDSHAGGYFSISSGETSFIHSRNSLVTGNYSAILGGENITGTTDNTVYVPNLNINSVPLSGFTSDPILVRASDGSIKTISQQPQYIEYKANLTQTGTSEPTAFLLGTPTLTGGTWSYGSPGYYYFYKQGAFSGYSNVEIEISNAQVLAFSMSNAGFNLISASVFDDDYIEVKTSYWGVYPISGSTSAVTPGANGSSADVAMSNDILNNTRFIVRVWS